MCANGRVVAEPRLSPDNTRVACSTTSAGRSALVVRMRQEDSLWGPEVVLTTLPSPASSRAYGGGTFDWVPDSSALVYVGGGGGEARGGLWLQPIQGGPPRCIATGLISAPSVSPDSRSVAYVVDTHHVEVVGLDEVGFGKAVRISGDADFCFDPSWSPDGSWVVWHEWDVPAMPWDSSRIVVRRADGSGEAIVAAGGEGVSVQQPRFSPDGSRLGFLCDAGGWLNVWACSWPERDEVSPLVEEEHEHGGPAWGQGQRSFAWSPDSRFVAYCRNEDGFGSLRVVEVEKGLAQANQQRIQQIGRGVHGGLSWVGDHLVAVRSGARTPTSVVVYSGQDFAKRHTLAVGPVAGFEAADLVEPEVVTWQGEDGEEIPGRLYSPHPSSSKESSLGDEKAPPLIAWVHGGPTDQWGVYFNARIAYWVERCWAVLVPDHRGSTGHGRAFTQAMATRWGELDVADVAAGLHAAIRNGWGDEDRLVVMGASAGGFTVLNLLATHPGLCAAGIDLYGVADLVDLAATTHRFEAHYLDSIVGALPDAKKVYESRSPVNRADKIVDPLLILQGLDDKVVPPSQSKEIAKRLSELGRVVEFHLYEGEGHGWGRPETVIDELERIESFLARHVLNSEES